MSISMKQIILIAAGFLNFVSGLFIPNTTNNATKIAPLMENKTTLSIEDARKFLEKINKECDEWFNKKQLVEWNYASNLTDNNLAQKLEFTPKFTNFTRHIQHEVNKYLWENISDDDLHRQFLYFSSFEIKTLPDEKFIELEEIISQMTKVYSTAKICDYEDVDNCTLTDEVEYSYNAEESKYIWTEWHNAYGKKSKDLYPKYVELTNMMAKADNLTDYSQYWFEDYEMDNITDVIESLWQKIKPLYLQIHAHVRYRLRKIYGENVIPENGLIPAQFLGYLAMNIESLTMPYPFKQMPNIEKAMVQQEYTVEKIFRVAENAFVSMNMSALPELFWNKSILQKPDDREIICYASSWDFYDGKDFRINQCSSIDVDSLYGAYHEMGHIQYFIQYKDQPHVFKKGANSAFHEAVGDVMFLSANTPSNLKKIGLLKSDEFDSEIELNYLYSIALDKIPFLIFIYAMEQWRWGVFQGNITSDHYNCEWWKLRGEMQGIEPPVNRSEDDFDPGVVYHIVSDSEIINYFFSHIIQFQFHKALCIEAGQYDSKNPNTKPLHFCDITSSTKAGNLLKSMLQMGSSKPWRDAMEKLTGQREIDATGLLEYFKPLYNWLKAENEKNGEHIGWDMNKRITKCVQNTNNVK